MKPLDEEAIAAAAACRLVVTVEEGVIAGGAGEGVLEVLARQGATTPAVTLGIRFFISKIYLLKEHRGEGLCSATIRFYERLARERGLDALYLTVTCVAAPSSWGVSSSCCMMKKYS